MLACYKFSVLKSGEKICNKPAWNLLSEIHYNSGKKILNKTAFKADFLLLTFKEAVKSIMLETTQLLF